MPVFNEQARIREAVRRVVEMPCPLEVELVVVDDCSTDGTREILEELDASSRVRLVLHDSNAGKGAALRTGFGHTTGQIVVIHDADLEYQPEDMIKVITPILENRADVVFGSRFVGGDSHRVLYFWHYVGNRLLTLLSNMLSNLNLSDMETGYKAFRSDVLRRITIQEDRFGVEPEMTAKVAKLGCRIYEVGVSYSGRTYAEGKKIEWRDGFRAIWCIIKYNLFSRRRHN